MRGFNLILGLSLFLVSINCSQFRTNTTSNVTSSAASVPPFDIIDKVFLALAALPSLGVWGLMYWIAPKRNFKLDDPFHKMRIPNAIASGGMIGQLLGHALPNISIYSEGNLPYFAAIIGVTIMIFFFRFIRATGNAPDQHVRWTDAEPIVLYDDDGNESPIVQLTGEGMFYEKQLDTEELSAGRANEEYFDNSSISASDAEQTLQMTPTLAKLCMDDAHDIRWIRRTIFIILYVCSLCMIMLEGPILSYNVHLKSTTVQIICFYFLKIMQAQIMASFAIFAYNHMRRKRYLCLTPYAWLAVGFAVTVAASSITVLLGISHDVVTLFVENGWYTAFYCFIAGIFLDIAWRYAHREGDDPTKLGEFVWVFSFFGAATMMWVFGYFI